jgi:hypothetical protein
MLIANDPGAKVSLGLEILEQIVLADLQFVHR